MEREFRVSGVLKFLLGVIVLLAVAAVGVFQVSRMQGMTPEREAVVELMTRPAEMPGRNAFATLWLLGHDVPDDQVEAVAAEDVARALEWPLPHEDGYAPFTSVAAERYGHAAGSGHDDSSMLCGSHGIDCLQMVRRDPQGAGRQLASLAVARRQMEALADAGHYRNEFPVRGDMLAPARLASVMTVPMTAQALSFVRGDMETAMIGSCRSVAMWRRLGSNSDSLIMSMVAISAVDGHSRLFADMLAELPDGAAVPKECDVAFVPPEPQESSICTAMKGEFAYSRARLREPERFGGDGVPWYMRWAFDMDATESRSAENLSAACSDVGLQAIVADRPLRALRREGFELECIANLGGCTLTAIAGPGYDRYLQRAQDHGARLRLMSTLLWLQRNARDARPLQTRLAARPAGTRSPTRDFEVVDGGRALQVAMFDDSRGNQWRVPLPRSVADR